MFGTRIRIAPELWEKLKERAEAQGYASVQEFITHVLEQIVEGMEESNEEEDTRERLEGLGYLS